MPDGEMSADADQISIDLSDGTSSHQGDAVVANDGADANAADEDGLERQSSWRAEE